jgi:hypothetical protein
MRIYPGERLVCEKRCGSTRFHGSAHIVDNWVVDESGSWIESTGTGDVVSEPDSFECECGANADIVRGVVN